MLRRTFAHLLLAFALLFAQQGGFAHELSHFAHDASQTGKQLPHSKACEQCATYSQLGTGVVSQAVPFDLPAVGCTRYAFRAAEYAAQHFFSHRSRAPPVPA